MELTNEVKIRTIQSRIDSLEQEQYGLSVDHEVQTFLGKNPTRTNEIEVAIADCIRVIKMLRGKIAELNAPIPELANGKEPSHANAS